MNDLTCGQVRSLTISRTLGRWKSVCNYLISVNDQWNKVENFLSKLNQSIHTSTRESLLVAMGVDQMANCLTFFFLNWDIVAQRSKIGTL